jgi:hypothetical protein
MHQREEFLLRAEAGAQDNLLAIDAAADAIRQVSIPNRGPAAPGEVA